MIAAVGNINIMEASQRTGTWLLLHAHGIITKPQRQRQQQLQIKANIKSGNFPWQRWKVTGKQQPTAKQTGEPTRGTYVEPQRTPGEPSFALALLFACHMRVRKDFRFTLLLANSSPPPS